MQDMSRYEWSQQTHYALLQRQAFNKWRSKYTTLILMSHLSCCPPLIEIFFVPNKKELVVTL